MTSRWDIKRDHAPYTIPLIRSSDRQGIQLKPLETMDAMDGELQCESSGIGPSFGDKCLSPQLLHDPMTRGRRGIGRYHPELFECDAR